jgi:glycosyltransferase involved in cell wall biosynthesis
MVFDYIVSKEKQFGTEQTADIWKEKVLPLVPDFETYNWNLLPGKFTPDLRFTVAWVHLEVNESVFAIINSGNSSINAYLFVSNWQAQHYLSYFPFIDEKRVFVVKNAIEPIPKHTKPSTEVINITYNADQYRGLNVLFKSLKYLKTTHPVKFHIYRNIDSITIPKDDRLVFHGRVEHDVLRKDLENMHIYAYPCTWLETSCISLMEALSAGCYCLTSNYGALIETGIGFTHQYQYIPDLEEHAKVFAKELDLAIENYLNGWDSTNQINAANQVFGWEQRVKDWVKLGEELKPYAEIRKKALERAFNDSNSK